MKERQFVRIENEKVVAIVPVTYSCWGEVELTFDSIAEMRKQLQDREFVNAMELPSNPTYIEDSYEVDIETVDYQTSLLSAEDKKTYVN